MVAAHNFCLLGIMLFLGMCLRCAGIKDHVQLPYVFNDVLQVAFLEESIVKAKLNCHFIVFLWFSFSLTFYSATASLYHQWE